MTNEAHHLASQQEYHHELNSRVVDSLSRVAVLHAVGPYTLPPSEMRSNKYVFLDRSELKSMRIPGAYVPQQLTSAEVPSSVDVHDKNTQANIQTLEAVRSAIFSRLEKHDIGKDPNWLQIAQGLLEDAERLDAEQKAPLLMGAVTCSQFAGDKRDRMKFVHAVYEKKLQNELADACESSQLVLMIDGQAPEEREDPSYQPPTKVHPISKYASAFRVKPEHMRQYLRHVAEGNTVGPDAELPSAKRMQKEVNQELRTGGALRPETDHTAREVAMNGEKVAGVLLDPMKLERFALQQDFIHKQIDYVIGPDVTNSYLASALARRRTPASNYGALPASGDFDPLSMAVAQLQLDLRGAVLELTQPLIEEYSLKGVDVSSPAVLSREQRNAVRYKVVLAEMANLRVLAEYLDFDEFLERNDDELAGQLSKSNDEIWSGSEDGGASDLAVGDAIYNLVQGALQADKKARDVTPEELRDFSQARRRMLLTFATQNISEVPGGDELFRGGTELELTRNDKHELVLKNEPDIDSPDSLDVYAAIALGCPALRVQHENRALLSMEQRIAHGSANFIDHILATVINEAYERGIFDIRKYSKSEPS